MKKELKKFTELYCKTCTAPCEKGITENSKEFICAETGHRIKKNIITKIIEESKKNK